MRPVHANISQVTPSIWIGGDLETLRPAFAGLQLGEIEELGITDIVDVRLEWNDHGWVREAKPHIGYLWLGVDDAGQSIPDNWFDEGTKHILERIRDGGTVLTHCHMGINRGPSMGFATMLALGWDPIEALARIRDRRPIAYVAYAENALDWWLRKSGAPAAERVEAQRRMRQWRRDRHLDVAGVIRRIRLQTRA